MKSFNCRVADEDDLEVIEAACKVICSAGCARVGLFSVRAAAAPDALADSKPEMRSAVFRAAKKDEEAHCRSAFLFMRPDHFEPDRRGSG
jgi:hypothetical protein